MTTGERRVSDAKIDLFLESPAISQAGKYIIRQLRAERDSARAEAERVRDTYADHVGYRGDLPAHILFPWERPDGEKP